MIAIIDYDAGNLKSVEKALIALGEEVIVSRDSSEILQADKVILPGVGSFGDAMNNLDRFGLVDTIKNVVTGKITKIEKHPDADRLNVCQVDIGAEEEIQIVTAATNMKEQDIVPVALHKSILADGSEIKKGKMRGVVSNGMFCSEEELGIAGDEPVHGLMILPEDAPLGMDIKEYLK